MEIADVLIARTTDPKDDDLWEKRWVCENEHNEPILEDKDE
jgi:hypothetical protein